MTPRRPVELRDFLPYLVVPGTLGLFILTPPQLMVAALVPLFLLVLVGLALVLRAAERRSPRLSEWLDRQMPDEPWWDQ